MTSPRSASKPESEKAVDWTARPERGSRFMLRLMLWLSRRLGRSVSRGILAGISLYFLMFVPKARRASRDYLQRVLGRPPRWWDLFRHVHTFASTVHDRVYLLDDRFDLFDIEVVDNGLLKPGQGMVLIGAHFGSFEVIRAISRQQEGFRVSMLMYPENARKINEILSIVNPEAVSDIIALGEIESMLKAQERIASGHLVGMLADRTLRQDSTRDCTFLGAPASFALGPFRMAALLRCPVVFMTGIYEGKNRYTVHFKPLADFTDLARSERAAAITDAQDRYVAILENFCRSRTYNWFNFFDFWSIDSGTMTEPDRRSPAKSTAYPEEQP
ncbi:acyl-CoA synthetase [Halothiobacillus sp.]|uniref:LpxL/LpxP family acyltransferase n=1 Tax=Halothiobacillus sp. TaxID=1891311 RepID=UPI002AD48137|nr:acyl-CoA synthetase [Halothiobacillus sp.]